jgi:hypothetical protein
MNIKILKVDSREAELYGRKTKIYIFIKNETLIQNLLERHSRPNKEYKKQIIPTLIKDGILPSDAIVTWSQKAGCSCGCSPGFIVKNDTSKEIFIDIEIS